MGKEILIKGLTLFKEVVFICYNITNANLLTTDN